VRDLDGRRRGGLCPLTLANGDPEQVRLAEASRSYPLGPAIEQVIDSGDPVLITEVTDEMIVEGAHDEEHLALLRDAELRSFLAVPVASRERVFGALGLIATGSARTFDETDLSVAADLGRRAATAIENSLLLQRAEEAAERAELQNEVGRVLAEATDEVAAVDRILESVCRALDWDVGQLWRPDDGGATLRAAGLWRRPGLETEAFELASRKYVVRHGAGLLGRAWATGELL
jgi:GAF domain-containing protein